MVFYDVKDLDNCLSKYKSIIVYGIGNYGKAFIDYVIDIGQKKKIKSVVVTDRTNTPGEYRNILISEAGELFNQTVYEDTCVILAVSLRYQKSIITQLDKFGISNYYCLTDEIYRKIAEGGYKGNDSSISWSDFSGGWIHEMWYDGFTSCFYEYRPRLCSGGKGDRIFFMVSSCQSCRRKIVKMTRV